MKYVADVRKVPAKVEYKTEEVSRAVNYPEVGTRVYFTDGSSVVYGTVTSGTGLDKYPSLANHLTIVSSWGQHLTINSTKFDIILLEDEQEGPDTLDGGSVD